MEKEKLRTITENQIRAIIREFNTPVFVYSQEEIEDRCSEMNAFPNAYGVTARFAMKANPNGTILRLIRKNGLHIDASSEYEVKRAMHAGFAAHEIMLTSQQMPVELKSIVEKGVFFNACSLRQLAEFGKLFPGRELSIRFNPGLGSGSTKKTDVGGATSSFGIWHEFIQDVKDIVKQYNLKVTKIHTHIGSGSDPEVWKAVAHYSLEIADQFSECNTLNLGGGFKVGRMSDESSVDVQKIGAPIKDLFEKYFQKTGKRLRLEVEPGTYLMANSGVLISTVDDVVSTGAQGMQFAKLNSGMDSNTRPALYGARHPMINVPSQDSENRNDGECVIVGHCCETGDVFTQKEGGEAYAIKITELRQGDFLVMGGAGAYCSSMSVKNYNSYPEAPEVLIDKTGNFHLIRKRQTLEQMIQNEVIADL